MPETDPRLPQGVPLYELNIPVRWGDMDALGHVNNAMYFRYFETVRMQWFAESLDQAPDSTEDDGIVIVDNHAQYLLPVVCPANALVRMGGHSPGTSSFVSTYTLTVNNTLQTIAHAKIVWVSNRTMKSKPLPDYIRQLL